MNNDPKHTLSFNPRRSGKNREIALHVQRFLHLNPRVKVALFTREGYAGEVVAVNLPAPLAEPETST